MTFSEWVSSVEEQLSSSFGILKDDCTDEVAMKNGFNAGETPQEFVEWLEEKYGFVRIY
jgi:hypothetical protein